MTISASPIHAYQASSASAGTAVNCTLTVSPAAGNLAVACISANTNDTIPTPTGWTILTSQTVDTTNVVWFYKRRAAGTELAVACTLAAAASWNVHYMEFNSTIGSFFVPGAVAKNVPQAAGTALATGTTAATVGERAIVIAAVTYAGARQTPSWSNSFTSNTGTASATTVFALETAFKIVTAKGTQTTTDTVGVSVAAGWTGCIGVIYEPAMPVATLFVPAAVRRASVR